MIEFGMICRSWRHAITEAKMNGGHSCKTGVAAIAWMAEKHAKTCDKCRQIFTATNKKHHCRCCGRIFCNDCSNAPKINVRKQLFPHRPGAACMCVRVSVCVCMCVRIAQLFFLVSAGVLPPDSDFQHACVCLFNVIACMCVVCICVCFFMHVRSWSLSPSWCGVAIGAMIRSSD
jgi:hypothetical protein